MAWRWLGDKPLSEPMMVNSLMHICVIRPQGVHSTLSWPEHFLNHWKHFWVNKSYPFHGFLWYFYLWSPRLGSLLLAMSKHPFLRGESSPKGSNVGWAKNTTLSKTKNTSQSPFLYITVVRLMKPTAVGFIRYGRRRSDRIGTARFVWKVGHLHSWFFAHTEILMLGTTCINHVD